MLMSVLTGDCETDDDLSVGSVEFIEEGEVPKGMKGLFKVETPSERLYMGRFSLESKNYNKARKEAYLICSNYQQKWCLNGEFLFAFEKSKEGVYHVHFVVKMLNEYKYSTMSDFWKKQVGIKTGSSVTWHKQINEINDKILTYTIKDNDILLMTFGMDLEDLKQQVIDIKKDMSKNPLEKLLGRIEPVFNKKWDMSDIAFKICEIYVDEYNKAPPMNQLKGWCWYIMMKLGDRSKVSFICKNMFD